MMQGIVMQACEASSCVIFDLMVRICSAEADLDVPRERSDTSLSHENCVKYGREGDSK